jgi:hypothetical protein
MEEDVEKEKNDEEVPRSYLSEVCIVLLSLWHVVDNLMNPIYKVSTVLYSFVQVVVCGDCSYDYYDESKLETLEDSNDLQSVNKSEV